MRTVLRDGIAELIGTFMLVFIGAGAVTVAGQLKVAPGIDVIIAALAHGLILVVIVATYGHISGAHVNPAVTLGLLICRQISVSKSIIFWIAQFIGAIIAAFVLRAIFPGAATIGNTEPNSALGITNVGAALIESVLTFFLASTVIQSAANRNGGNAAPLYIGFTLAACIMFGGALTGASLNPARTLGPALITNRFDPLIWYMIGIFGGGAVAGIVHTLLSRPEPNNTPTK